MATVVTAAKLRASVALCSTQREARASADRRVGAATDTVQRRADGDLRDAAERLSEERERFKSQLAAAHAHILRLSAEIGDCKKRNVELEIAKDFGAESHGVRNKACPCGQESSSLMCTRSSSSDGDRASGDAARPSEDGGGKGHEDAAGDLARAQESSTPRSGDQNALQLMCNGLVVELREAREERSKADEERQVLIEVLFKLWSSCCG